MTTSINKRKNFFTKIYNSHTLFSKGSVMCERWVETGRDCYIDPSSSLYHSSTSSSSCRGCSTEGRWGPQPSICKLVSHSGIPVSLSSRRPTAPVYILSWHPPASAFLPLFYTGVYFDWRLGLGSLYNNTQRVSSKIGIPQVSLVHLPDLDKKIQSCRTAPLVTKIL